MFSGSRLLGAFIALQPALALAQYGAATTPQDPASGSTASSATAAANSTGGTTHMVLVGKDGLTFTPNSIQAAVGDQVTFTFYAKNHTVTQSSFAAPCNGLGTTSAASPKSNGTVSAGSTKASGNPSAGSSKSNGTANNESGKTDKEQSSLNSGLPGSVVVMPGGMSPGAAIEQQEGSKGSKTGSGGGASAYRMRRADKASAKGAANTTSAAGGMVGIDSGYVPVAANVTGGFPTFTMTISDTKPLWFACMQTNHCGSGMTFAINAPATGNTYDKYLATAKTFANISTGYAASSRLNGQGCTANAAVDRSQLVVGAANSTGSASGSTASGSSSATGSTTEGTTSGGTTSGASNNTSSSGTSTSGSPAGSGNTSAAHYSYGGGFVPTLLAFSGAAAVLL